MAHDDTYDWLGSDLVLAWLKIDDADDQRAAAIEQCRLAAADWIEDQRRDLLDDSGAFTPTPRIVQAGLLSVARLAARIDSPNGVVSFAELGAGSILSTDPDVRRMLGRNQRPVIG